MSVIQQDGVTKIDSLPPGDPSYDSILCNYPSNYLFYSMGRALVGFDTNTPTMQWEVTINLPEGASIIDFAFDCSTAFIVVKESGNSNLELWMTRLTRNTLISFR